jgi:hypothetical protein
MTTDWESAVQSQLAITHALRRAADACHREAVRAITDRDGLAAARALAERAHYLESAAASDERVGHLLAAAAESSA